MTGFYSGLLVNPALAYNGSHNGGKIVIAHRGASGYLPEHTLAGKAMAYAMGADYLEQDLVMTKDNRLVVLHDIILNHVTNVRDIFPGRARKDGNYYVVDFTLAELKKLAVIERFNLVDGKRVAVFKDRFPLGKSTFRIHSFEEEIELIQGLNKSTGKNVGIYPEIKNVAFHNKEGKDVSRAVLKILKAYGYTKKSDKIYLQSFNARELKRVHDVLLPEMGMKLKLVLLLWPPDDAEWVKKPGSMIKVAKYADAIGPDKSMLISKKSVIGHIIATDLASRAHAAGLEIHPYTFRTEQIPPYAKNYTDLLNIFLFKIGVDGIFTDFTDKTVNFLKAKP
ncbi:MAG: glycerophosphodiester phosphodiesterase [Alphaproteobacteria bacterium]|nr:glycerophosphodiester phosphodiesterase [Alphaproteobacteria bacterium]